MADTDDMTDGDCWQLFTSTIAVIFIYFFRLFFAFLCIYYNYRNTIFPLVQFLSPHMRYETIQHRTILEI